MECLEYDGRPEAATIRDVLIPYLERYAKEDAIDLALNEWREAQRELAHLFEKINRLMSSLVETDRD
jgi:hypothetical protein